MTPEQQRRESRKRSRAHRSKVVGEGLDLGGGGEDTERAPQDQAWRQAGGCQGEPVMTQG